MSCAILRVLAEHVEEVDLVLEDAALVEHLDGLDRLLEAVGMAGHGLGVHDLALDEVDDERALGVDLVRDGRADAELGRLDHAVPLDVTVDEHVGADAGHAHDVLLAALLGAAVDPDDVVVVGDAAAEFLGADSWPFQSSMRAMISSGVRWGCSPIRLPFLTGGAAAARVSALLRRPSRAELLRRVPAAGRRAGRAREDGVGDAKLTKRGPRDPCRRAPRGPRPWPSGSPRSRSAWSSCRRPPGTSGPCPGP